MKGSPVRVRASAWSTRRNPAHRTPLSGASSSRLSDRPPGEAGATVARLKGGRNGLRALLVVPALLALACAAASSAHAGFFFGFSDDGPKWGGAVEPGRAVGASAFRITLNWVPGESDL